MAYKIGSISKVTFVVNLFMCICAGASAYFFAQKDYFSAWVSLLATAILISGIPIYIKRMISNITSLVNSYNQNWKSKEVELPGFADELIELNRELISMKARIEDTCKTNAMSAVIIEKIIEHLPFAVLVYDEQAKVYYSNDILVNLIGEKVDYITAASLRNRELMRKISLLEDGKQIVFSDNSQDLSREFLLSKNSFSFDNNTHFLVTMKDIKSEMDTQESVSWQKLIRVLNHEIANSLTPIASLSDTLLIQMDNPTESFKSNLSSSLKLFSKRTKGLMKFVKRYRQLAVIEKPELKPTELKVIIKDTISLFEKEFEDKEISVSLNATESSAFVNVDQAMFQQVLINLMKNSIESMNQSVRKKLFINLVEQETDSVITILDTGSGISPDALPNIFIPFFTTKKDGSGIGLAITKQIIRLHRGDITATSIPNEETVFKITLPNSY